MTGLFMALNDHGWGDGGKKGGGPPDLEDLWRDINRRLGGLRTVEVGYRGSDKNKVPKEALMLTDDENIVSVEFAVQYLLKDPQNYLFPNRNPDDSVVQAAE